jgi:hypothetical protein
LALIEKTQYPRAEVASQPVQWPGLSSTIWGLTIGYSTSGHFEVQRGITNSIAEQHYFYSGHGMQPVVTGPANSLLRDATSPAQIPNVPEIWEGTEYKTVIGPRTEERQFVSISGFTSPGGLEPWMVKTTLNSMTRGEVLLHDSFSDVTHQFEYDYGAIPSLSQYPADPEALSGYLRRTDTTYRTETDFTAGPYLRSLVAKRIVYGPGKVKKAETEYEYDVYGGASDDLLLRGTVTGFTSPGAVKRGNATKVRRWLDAPAAKYLETVQSYDELGNLVKSRDPKGNATTFGFSGACAYGVPTLITNPLNHRRQIAYDCAIGRPTSSGIETTTNVFATTGYQYNDTLDRLTSVTLPLVGSRSFEYNDAAREIMTTIAQNSCSGGENQRAVDKYDTLGRLVRTETDSGAATVDIVERQYDDHGRLWKQSHPYRTAAKWTTLCLRRAGPGAGGDSSGREQRHEELHGKCDDADRPRGEPAAAHYRRTGAADDGAGVWFVAL